MSLPSRTPARRPRPTALAVAVLVATSALVVGACGGSDEDTAAPEKQSGERPESTTTEKKSSNAAGGIASGILSTADSAKLDDSAVSSDEEECLGAEVIDAVGEAEATQMSEADLSQYTPAQLEVLRDAFNTCVSGETLAGELVVNFYEGAGATKQPGAEVTTCVASAIDGRTGDIVVESAQLQSDTALPQITLEVLDTCVPAADVALLLTDAFQQAGLPAAQASCMATTLSDQISVSQLAELGNAAQIPPEVQALVNAAAAGCAPG